MEPLRIELDREDDGRWIADIPQIPGVMVYGETRDDAVAKVEALALRVIADRVEHNGLRLEPGLFVVAAA
jgi:predicted RNase H-like HicB family nuclease